MLELRLRQRANVQFGLPTLTRLVLAVALASGCGRTDPPRPTATSSQDDEPTRESSARAQPSGATPAPSPADDMVAVPAGRLRSCVWANSGGLVPDSCAADEAVEVGSFLLDRTETTVAKYGRCVEQGACTIDGLSTSSACNWAHRPDRSDHPINCVSWKQANAFCNWANKRLPTKAEWERAARGPDERLYPWGARSTPPTGTRLGGNEHQPPALRRALGLGMCWGKTGTCVVDAAGPPNDFGLVGMAGNVAEWVQGAPLDDSRLGRHDSPDSRGRDWRILLGTSWAEPEVDEPGLLGLMRATLRLRCNRSRVAPDRAWGCCK